MRMKDRFLVVIVIAIGASATVLGIFSRAEHRGGAYLQVAKWIAGIPWGWLGALVIAAIAFVLIGKRNRSGPRTGENVGFRPRHSWNGMAKGAEMFHISDVIQATGLLLFVILVGIGGNLAPHMHYKRTGEKSLFPWAGLNTKEWSIALAFFGAGATFAFLGICFG